MKKNLCQSCGHDKSVHDTYKCNYGYDGRGGMLGPACLCSRFHAARKPKAKKTKRCFFDSDGKKFTRADRALAAKARKLALTVPKQRPQERGPYVWLQQLHDREEGEAARHKKLGKPYRKNYYSDVVELILATNTTLLLRFVERELYAPGNVQINWEHSEEFRKAKRTMDKLYLFFKAERPALEAAIDKLQHDAYVLNDKAHGGEMFEPLDPKTNTHLMKPSTPEATKLYRKSWKLDQELDQKTTEALCNLMKIRHYLWT